jgi:hypothetical protein
MATGNTPIVYAGLILTCWKGIDEPALEIVTMCEWRSELTGSKMHKRS